MSKTGMINEILLAYKAGGGCADGDVFLALAFRTETELEKICSELNISTE